MIKNIVPIPLSKFDRYTIDEDGTVYGRKCQPLTYFYSSRGYKKVALTAGKLGQESFYVDRLMALAYHGIPTDEEIDVIYNDGNANNVALSNLTFIRK